MLLIGRSHTTEKLKRHALCDIKMNDGLSLGVYLERSLANYALRPNASLLCKPMTLEITKEKIW